MNYGMKFFHLYKDGSDGIKIMQHIVDEFIKTANMRDEIPIIIVFPIRHSVDIVKKYRKNRTVYPEKNF